MPQTPASRSRDRILIIATLIIVPIVVGVLIWLKSGWFEKVREPSDDHRAGAAEKSKSLQDAIKKGQDR